MSLNDKLYNAAEKNDLKEVKRLYALGADLNTKENNCFPIIDLAASFGYLELLKWLHIKGAQGSDMKGHLGIQLAAINGHLEVVKFLSDKGPKIQDWEYYVPNVTAHGWITIQFPGENPTRFKLHKDAPGRKDCSGIDCGHIEVMKWLYSKGAPDKYFSKEFLQIIDDEKKINELQSENEKLRTKLTELRFRPGYPGFLEAKKSFEECAKNNKSLS